jgi:hypothetical protein
MKEYVKLYEEHSQESMRDRAQSAQYELEEYKPEFPIGEYQLDSDDMPDSGRGEGPSKNVWVMFTGLDPAMVKDVEDDYEKYQAHFKAWCDERGLYDPSILTTDDSVTFNVVVY